MPNTENITIEVENNVVRIIEDIPQPEPKIVEKTLEELYAEKQDYLNQKNALTGELTKDKAKLQVIFDENVAYLDQQLEITQKAIDDGILQGATIGD